MPGHYTPLVGRPSGHKETLSVTPNTVVAIPIPGERNTDHRPKRCTIAFVDANGSVQGRFGFATDGNVGTGAGERYENFDDASDILGHQPVDIEKDEPIPRNATHLHVASSTASAICYVTWRWAVAC